MSSATLRGRVVGPDGSVIPKARVRLANPISGQTAETTTDEEGVFSFFNLPHNAFILTIEAVGFAKLTRNLDVHGDGTMELGDLSLSVNELQESVSITANESLLETDNTSSHHDIDQSLVEHLPTAVASRGMEQIMLATPGFIADENGRFHFRGSHGQVSYVVDGVPINDQMDVTFSNSLDPTTLSALEITTGGIPAEYGDRAAAVKVTTKSGLESKRQFFGEASYGLSSFNTNEAAVKFGGSTPNKRFGYFTSLAGSVSDRFLDPINFDNLHNNGNSQSFFSRFDFQAAARDTLTLNLALGRTDHEVPNLLSQEAAGQDQSVLLRDGSINLGWQHVIDNHAFFEVRSFYRSSQQQLFGSEFDTPITASYDRRLANYGVTANFNYDRGQHRFKTGITTSAFPLRENLDFSITSATFNAPFLTPGGAPDPADNPANFNNP
ncbi:MAG: carboxypeptidase regulatory-like domain-containing protein, partial [Blastocatellia bacterium]|nr:carboxypeptidase regulatory-like domain-containing protein [Blastocatellia bacterium]